MTALKVRFGYSHSVTHIDNQGGKLIVELLCGGSQEVNESNQHRLKIISADGEHVGCPFCRMSLETEGDENQDDHSNPADA